MVLPSSWQISASEGPAAGHSAARPELADSADLWDARGRQMVRTAHIVVPGLDLFARPESSGLHGGTTWT